MATPEPSQSYPSDLTDTEWKVVEAIVGDSSKVGRPPRFERRAVINAIFYMVRTGGSWRFLPHDLPPWRIVYYYYSRWRNEGLWQKLHDGLRDAAREARAKKNARPPRYWIPKVCAQLAGEECAAMMLERRCWVGNATFWWIQTD
ncbi:hypothetical protein llg_10940 [Luteolibacter sp. LG18]|nr:hypothetical protein llg_10940 [Luteolibacter sp. LG18]